MASVNKAIILGNLGNDPEMRTTQSGSQVANFNIATNEKFKDSSGEWQERTEWHKIVAFGRTAEICGQYLSKGRSVFIEGRIQTRKWEDKEGQTRYSTEIVCQNMQMLGGRGEGGMGGGGGGGGMAAASGEPSGGAGLSADDEDLPF
jgi:single-strand DNA-binding protein